MQKHNAESTNLSGLMKSHHCAELRLQHKTLNVTLCGWVNKSRDLGGLYFIDIRDKYGLTQLAFDEFEDDLAILKEISLESVIKVEGLVRNRPDSAINKRMDTGEIEISVKKLTILSKAAEVPFLPHGKVGANEDLKLKYRYIDLRTHHLQNMLTLRSNTMRDVRTALYEEGFTEIETPILYKTTPEGARDYVVPSRVHPGKVYALPQSPQTLKQLLMIGNADKYFQICKCFRDEDLRADRQPEFSQIDIEVSFAAQEYIKNLALKIIKKLFVLDDNFTLETMSYNESMRIYGSDKPDARFGLEHMIVNDDVKTCGFKVFDQVLEDGGLIKSIFVKKSQKEFTRKEIDALANVVKPHGGQGVAWFKINDGNLSGGVTKFINDQTLINLQKNAGTKEDGIFFFFASSKPSITHACADVTRRHFGKELGLIDKNSYKFLWINDFPLLEYKEEDGRYYACHHPFTMPKLEYLDDFMEGKNLEGMPAEAYDLVCNGYEMGGGSLRIFDSKVQSKMFQTLGFSQADLEAKFGFFVEALKYGTPPHAGMAFGLDRTVMLLAKSDNIRDVIAFPKTNAATDLMCSAPSLATPDQYEELHIASITNNEK